MRLVISFFFILIFISSTPLRSYANFYSDRDFDGTDLHQFIRAYGSNINSPNYLSDADLVFDENVDNKDLEIVAIAFGKIYSTEGVLLQGNPDSPASVAVYDFDNGEFVVRSEISTTSEGVDIARPKFKIAFKEEATIADINNLLSQINGKITCMLEGVNSIVVRIPDPGDLNNLEAVISNLESNPFVRYVIKAYFLKPQSLPDNYLPNSNMMDRIQHHLSIRAHAAWNIKDMLQNTIDPPLVIVGDHFGGGLPNVDFDLTPQINIDYGFGFPSAHGYHVLGIIAGTFGGFQDNRGSVTGIYPGTLNARVVDAMGPGGAIDSPTFNNRLIQIAKNSNSNVVVNTSLSTLCAKPSERSCIDPLARDWIEMVRGSQLYTTGNTGQGSLENKFLHITAAGNVDAIGDTEVSLNGKWTAAAMLNDLETFWGQSLNPLENTLAIENREILTSAQPFKPGCLFDGFSNPFYGYNASKYPGHLSAIGTNVWSFTGGNIGSDYFTGTSMAAPQVAGLAALIWALEPLLTPQNVKEILLKTAATPGSDSNCLVPPKPVIDAYAAVLAVDTLSDPKIRKTLLDVADDGGFFGKNDSFDEKDIVLFLSKIDHQIPPSIQTTDYSRYDLNGDGYTGGENTERFDLSIDNPATFTSIVHNIEPGKDACFDENNLTDLQILCYYAYSPLYLGDLDQRSELLADICVEASPCQSPCPDTNCYYWPYDRMEVRAHSYSGSWVPDPPNDWQENQCGTVFAIANDSTYQGTASASYGSVNSEAQINVTNSWYAGAGSQGRFKDFLLLTPHDPSLIGLDGYFTATIRVQYSATAETRTGSEGPAQTSIGIGGSADNDYFRFLDGTIFYVDLLAGDGSPIEFTNETHTIKGSFVIGEHFDMTVEASVGPKFSGIREKNNNGKAQGMAKFQWLGITGFFTQDGIPITEYDMCTTSGTNY